MSHQPQFGAPQAQYGQPQPGANYYPPPYPQPAGYPPPATGQPHIQQPIVMQPSALQGQYASASENWMTAPAQIPGSAHAGLQYLTTIDQLMVKQKIELMEVVTGFETNNKYTIKNSQGQNVFYAIEDNDCCTRMCCGSGRPFDIKILDISQNEVIHLHRDFACGSCLCPCSLHKLEVYAPPGNLVGTVEETWSLCVAQFDIKNESGNTVMKIEGPGVCECNCCSDVEFNILSLDKSATVGKISKKWSGLAREAFTDADNFGISFPLDLDLRMKAVMIGACFLIDFMYFEKSNNN